MSKIDKGLGVQESGIGNGEEFTGWPAELQAESKTQKKGKGRRKNEGPANLSLNSLLDIVTIILVYLLKSFASSPVSVPDPNVHLPDSSAQLVPEEAAVIMITTTKIVAGDEAVAEVVDGTHVDANDKRDGEKGYFITPLYDAMVAQADNEKKIAQYNPAHQFKGISILICDKRIPFRLLSEVMYTAGQAEYGNFKFAVIKRE